MREILFRGKQKYNGEWIISGNVFFGGSLKYMYFPNPDNGPVENVFVCREVIPETVGQYTGLTDKNGKKIFEGDVCRNIKTGEVFSVKWHGTFAGFVWSRRKENSCLCDFGELFRCFDRCEVIGNIHDNPELLKESDN